MAAANPLLYKFWWLNGYELLISPQCARLWSLFTPFIYLSFKVTRTVFLEFILIKISIKTGLSSCS